MWFSEDFDTRRVTYAWCRLKGECVDLECRAVIDKYKALNTYNHLCVGYQLMQNPPPRLMSPGC